MRRGNRHLVGVVLGGRSGGSRDATMRSLLAENLEKGATKRTVAAITERNSAKPIPTSPTPMPNRPRWFRSRARCRSRPPPSPASTRCSPPRRRARQALADGGRSRRLPAQPKPEARPQQAKPEPAPLTSGVIQSQPLAVIPGSSEPMKPVRVKTVQVKAGAGEACLRRPRPADRRRSPTRFRRRAETCRRPRTPWWPRPTRPTMPKPARGRATRSRPDRAGADLPPQPAGHGTGNGVLGVLPASSAAAAPAPAPRRPWPMPSPPGQPQPAAADPRGRQQNGATKPVVPASPVPAGSSRSARWRARARPCSASRPPRAARGMLSKADPFTEPVVAKDNRKLYRARFAGLERDQAEAVCRTLKRADISCITVRN